MRKELSIGPDNKELYLIKKIRKKTSGCNQMKNLVGKSPTFCGLEV